MRKNTNDGCPTILPTKNRLLDTQGKKKRFFKRKNPTMNDWSF